MQTVVFHVKQAADLGELEGMLRASPNQPPRVVKTRRKPPFVRTAAAMKRCFTGQDNIRDCRRKFLGQKVEERIALGFVVVVWITWG